MKRRMRHITLPSRFCLRKIGIQCQYSYYIKRECNRPHSGSAEILSHWDFRRRCYLGLPLLGCSYWLVHPYSFWWCHRGRQYLVDLLLVISQCLRIFYKRFNRIEPYTRLRCLWVWESVEVYYSPFMSLGLWYSLSLSLLSQACKRRPIIWGYFAHMSEITQLWGCNASSR